MFDLLKVEKLTLNQLLSAARGISSWVLPKNCNYRAPIRILDDDFGHPENMTFGLFLHGIFHGILKLFTFELELVDRCVT